jgi:putative membrane protein
MSTFRPLAAVVVSSLMFAACSKQGSSPESETAADNTTSTPETTVVAEPMAPPAEPPPEPVATAPVEQAPAPTPLTDAQIAKVLEAVDTGEIEQAKVAQKKAKHPRVKKFAQHMIQQHTKAKQKGTTLAKKAQLTPEESEVSTQLTGKATAQLDALKTAEAAEFDALYMQGQAAQHQEVLDLVNARLIPAATNDALKSHLAETRTMVESHIKDASDIQQALATTTSGAAGAAGPTSGTTGAGAGAPGTGSGATGSGSAGSAGASGSTGGMGATGTGAAGATGGSR